MKYPKVNYIGNKEKLSKWICDNFPEGTNTLFDAFSGGVSVSYEAKKRGYEVYSNDILKSNYHLAIALIKNKKIVLNDDDIETIFNGKPFEGFMSKNYSNVYFFLEECKQLDLIRKNIDKLLIEEKRSLSFALIRRAMIRKMPYSRFTINWEKIVQLRDEEYSYRKYKRKRAYHNKSFQYHFINELESYNNAVFDNQRDNLSYNDDVFNLCQKLKADIIYLDPPYAGTMNNYFGFYGLIDSFIDSEIKKPFENNFIDKKNVVQLFDNLFSKLSNYKYWMLSYNESSYPSRKQMLNILSKYSNNINVVERKHNYQITGKIKKRENKELLFIVENQKNRK